MSDNIHFYLFDKTEYDKIYFGFSQTAAFYNSLEKTAQLLSDMSIINASKENLKGFKNKFNIVISCIAWGFHFPVSTYIDEVFEALCDDGILIIDIRKETSGIAELSVKFNIKLIGDYQKHLRVVCSKKSSF